jgi:hypothetical protein
MRPGTARKRGDPRDKGTSALIQGRSEAMPGDPARSKAGHVQDFLEMELAGLEPATSWVRFRLARGDLEVRRCGLAGGLRLGRGADSARMPADSRGLPLDSGTRGD